MDEKVDEEVDEKVEEEVDEEAELHNVNFFTQIISVQLNLPQEKARNCEKFLTF